MLVIHEEQVEALRQAGLHRFEEEMAAHLAEFSPAHCEALGEERLRQAVHLGVAQAYGHGFTFRGPVRLYLELMLLFGGHFDTDPQYPWAAEAMEGLTEETQMPHAVQLYEKAMDYRRQVAGPKDTFTLAALANIVDFLRRPLPVSSEHFLPDMLREIAALYPQKAAHVGQEGLQALIRKGVSGAQRQHFATVHGVVLVVLLMLAFGHGCGNDPLYPWILETLTDPALADPAEKARRLEEKALAWIDYVLANADKDTQA